METPAAPVKRRPGRPRKNPLPVVVEEPKLESTPQIVIDESSPPEDMPPLEEAFDEPPMNFLPPEAPIRFPNHLSSVELRAEITKYANIVGGRMKQLVDELNRRFPFQR
jgi:hypothetical protein